jgi:hypothetical protein
VKTNKFFHFLLIVLIFSPGCRKESAVSKERQKPSQQTILLYEAAEKGNIEQVKALIAKGVDVNIKDKDGNTPLHEAALNGHRDVVEFLIANGADAKARTKEGKTALDYARDAGFIDVIKALQGDVTAESFSSKGPYRVIVTDPKSVRRFLGFDGLKFDDVWIPDEKDVDDLEHVLKSYLENNTALRTNTRVDRKFVLAHFRRYNREYSGFSKDGSDYIFCSMHLADDFSQKPPENNFTLIMDGGSAVVRVIFNARTKEVVRIDCNGEA